MISKSKYIYMRVTQDDYELPLFVSESPSEIAKFDGTSSNCVMTIAGKAEKGLEKKPRYRRVLKENEKPM